MYGGSNPSYSASYNGLVANDTSTVVTGLSFISAGTTSTANVGSYAITASASASNYAITYVNGTLTVNPAPLTITALDTNKVYGGSNPSYSASYNGLVANDTSTVVTGLSFISAGTTSTANVGSYAITASASASNYAITYVNGTLTVNPAPLTITALDAGKTYGTTGGPYTASYSGLVAGDTSSVVTGLSLASAGDPTSANVGSYAITASGATDSNYTISYGPNATLSVTPANLTITAQDAARLYNTTNPTFSASYAAWSRAIHRAWSPALPGYQRDYRLADRHVRDHRRQSGRFELCGHLCRRHAQRRRRLYHHHRQRRNPALWRHESDFHRQLQRQQ